MARKQVTIALDAMGGDQGLETVLPGAELALVRRPDVRFLLFGQEEKLKPFLAGHPRVAAASEVVHAPISVAMDAKPSVALRQGRRDSSMARAIFAVRDGEADIALSAGNTGALMAMSKIILKTMPGIERPAIAAIWPTVDGECIALDMGANVGASARQLADFALMGAAMARSLFGLEKPKVGLLNIGVEEAKGLDDVKRAHQWLREVELPLDYSGFIEGDKIGQGAVDVVVTEGFSGNIALKTAEGTAKQISAYLRAAMNRSLFARLGGLLAYGAFQTLKLKMDPRRLNGGVFLGLNGLVIKSHGGTDAVGYASAIELAHDVAQSSLQTRLRDDLERFHKIIDRDERSANRASDERPERKPKQDEPRDAIAQDL